MRKLTVFLVIFIVVLIPVMPVYAWPSSDFYEEEDNIFDDWDVCRTSCLGESGFLQMTGLLTPEFSFRPVIAFESLGEYADTAYRLGEQFAEKYPDRHQRAEKIFEYVRDRVQYVPDIDQFDVDEYAQNADEVANTIEEDGTAYGDCEDMGILLAVMYQGAGLRSAIVWCPGHAAALVYVPGYKKANVIFLFEGESGWVWAEATGNTNQFGWFPVGQIMLPVMAYEISSDEHIPLRQPPEQVTFFDTELEATIREAINKPQGAIYTSDLESLTTLSAAERGILNLTGLEHCVNLQILDLSDNDLSDISPLAGLTNLQILIIDSNDISDISPLASLTNLQILSLYACDISDISSLVENSGLSQGDVVFLYGNPLSTTSVNDYIPQLEARGVNVQY